MFEHFMAATLTDEIPTLLFNKINNISRFHVIKML